MPVPAYYGCDHRLKLRNVKNEAGTLITDGTATYAITSINEIDGEYVIIDSGSLTNNGGGAYSKVLDADVISEMAIGQHYRIQITFTDPAGNDMVKSLEVYGAYQS